ncbi:MAG: PDZ domain-containing protein [Phycisphaeraceae bacterium]|nr:PDZ domain-containing protein [Phycisphaeraceae bacterium]
MTIVLDAARARGGFVLASALTALLGAAPTASADIDPHGGMLLYPDVSADSIVFVYANDLWVVDRAGGMARPLASPPGAESFPKFSPDGQTIGFVGNYEGDRDLYTISVNGGVPTRVTHHPANEQLSGWTPDGRLVYSTNGFSGQGQGRQEQIFTVAPQGGMPEKLPIPYGANGAVSGDGGWLAYTPHPRDFRTWKRYRGGWASDIWLFNLNTYESVRMTDFEGTDTIPMWHGDTVYYLSDRGDEHRLNIWSYNTQTRNHEQITAFKDYDVKWPSIGPGERGRGEIVFQNGAEIYLLDLNNRRSRVVDVTIPGDRPAIAVQREDASELIMSWGVSPGAKRATVEARGDIWTLPAKNGSPRNLTRTSGVAERDPVWSPDGRWIAYLSDATGEYEIYVTQSDGKGETRQLTHDGAMYRYMDKWSPDSKKLIYHDKSGAFYILDIESGDSTLVDKNPQQGARSATSWSHDSRWIAYDMTQHSPNPHSVIMLYDTESGQKHQVTNGMLNTDSPAFDRKGEFLYYSTSINFSPTYSDLPDTTWIYEKPDSIIAVPLLARTASPLAPKSDEQTWDEDDDSGDAKDKGDDDGGDKAAADEAPEDDGVTGVWEGRLTGSDPIPPDGADFSLTLRLNEDGSVKGSFSSGEYAFKVKGAYDEASGVISGSMTSDLYPPLHFTITIDGESLSATINADDFHAALSGERTIVGVSDDEGDGDDDDSEAVERVEIDLDGFERRGIELPIDPGNFAGLSVNSSDALLYLRIGDGGADLKVFNPADDEPEEKNVASGVNGYLLTPDGKNVLVLKGGASAVIQGASAGSTPEPVPTAGMSVNVNPREEWEEVMMDAWRRERDFFYDPHMHGVDWAAVRDHYMSMLDDCVSREDVGFLIREMISEINVGHAYYRPGPTQEDQPAVGVGMLGCEFALENGAFRITHIHEGAEWDADARGPLSQPGVKVREGDYLLAVNGTPLDTGKDVWSGFIGLGGRTVTLTVASVPNMDGVDAEDLPEGEIGEAPRDIVVNLLGSDMNLRFREWIEGMRRHVDEMSDGKVGYIYVINTGVPGQSDLLRQYFGQLDKEALIVDDRWNGGGQIPTRFIEVLNRPITNYWAVRDGDDWQWPVDGHRGPKCMLINGPSASGGDAFPSYFRIMKLGKLIGMRTWGGLVGYTGNPQFIDGSGVTVPSFAYYDKDGTWGIEGHGVDPDIEVVDDPALMVDGGDPQLDAAITLMLSEIERNGYHPPKRPAYPDRSGFGIKEEDK